MILQANCVTSEHEYTPSETSVLNMANHSMVTHFVIGFFCCFSAMKRFMNRMSRWVLDISMESSSQMSKNRSRPTQFAVVMTPFRAVGLAVLPLCSSHIRNSGWKDLCDWGVAKLLTTRELGTRNPNVTKQTTCKSNPRSVQRLTTGSREIIQGDSWHKTAFTER